MDRIDIIDNRVHELSAHLRENVTQGAGELVEFAMEHASDNQLVNSALLLKLNHSRADNVLRQGQLANEMVALTERIGRDAVTDLEATTVVKKSAIAPLEKRREMVCWVSNVNKTFQRSGFNMQGINAEFRLGEITGVVGENGNGKTTLFRMISGELAADSGLIQYPYLEAYFGISRNDWGEIKQRIAFIPQHLEKWYGSVRDNLHYELALHGIKGETNEEEVEYIIYRLGLEEHQNKKWSQLSGGYRLRFALARALVWKPVFLVIDEPLANLDIKAQLVILNDLRDLANSYRYPLSVVVSSQHLHEIEHVSDNIIFMKEGEVIYNGKTDNLGEGREENTFEFASELTLEEMERSLGGFEYYSIEHTGLAYVMHTPLHVTQMEVMQRFISADIEVTYFRDISKSTKKMFV